MEKKVTSIISLIFLVAGLSFLVNSQANITGAVIGISTPHSIRGYFTGAFFILVSFILFVVSIGGLEKKVIITNSINQINAIKKLSDKSRIDPVIARDLDHLRGELNKGNFGAGSGYRYLGDKISEIKTTRGARLYFMKTSEGYNMIGESSKKLQTKAIPLLKYYVLKGCYK